MTKRFDLLLATCLLAACSSNAEKSEANDVHAEPIETPTSTEMDQHSEEGAEEIAPALEEEPYPFTAVMSCGMNGFENLNLMACLGGDVGTEIEINNGGNYGLYKVYNIPSDWEQTERGVEIPLAQNFAIKMQNSNENLILGLRIFDNYGNIRFQKQVGQYGVISISN